MSDWRESTLGDLISVKHGYAFKGQFFASEGQEIVLTPGNFPVGGGLQFRDGKERFYTGPYPPEYRLNPGQLLLVMTDLKQDAPILGSPAFVPESPSVLHNQRLGLVEMRDGVDLDVRFLFYLLLSDETRSQLRGTATGSTVRHTAPERIYRVKVRVPPLRAQRAIGSALGSMDDLIVNNARRIAMLEEMARAIYREWFVEFRYPGHEGVALVESDLGPIPEGWSVVPLADACDFVNGKPISKQNRTGGSTPVYGANGLIGSTSMSPPNQPCVVMGKIGSCGALHRAETPCWVTNNAFAVYPSAIGSAYLVWLALREIDFTPLIGGSANPYLPLQNFGHLATLVPPPSITRSSDAVLGPLFALQRVLHESNRALRLTRDLLLPRLVSGEVDVSGLDIDVGDAAA